MQIFKLNKRDKQGLLGYLILTILISWLALPIMIGREVYQWKRYNLSRFEWEDIIRYGLEIIIISIIRGFIF